MNKRKGFTLVELLVVILLMSIVGVAMVSLLRIPIMANVESDKEYSLQSELRVTSETINNGVRNASAAFLLSKDPASTKTAKWNYLICENDDAKTSIILYRWDGTKHTRQVLAEASAKELDYSIEFETTQTGQLLNYKIFAKNLKTGAIDDISSEIKPLNSFNIIDNSKVSSDSYDDSTKKKANCLAFRTDMPNPEMQDAGYDRISVTFVLDLSGSMQWGMSNASGKQESRLKILEKATRVMLNRFAAIPGDRIDVKLVPYSGSAYQYHFYDGVVKQNLNLFKDVDYGNPSQYFNGADSIGVNKEGTIHSLMSLDSTNTGDGMRMGYYEMKKYNEKHLENNPNIRIKNYIMILTDGMANTITSEKIAGERTEDILKTKLFENYTDTIKMNLSRSNLEVDRKDDGIDLDTSIRDIYKLTEGESARSSAPFPKQEQFTEEQLVNHMANRLSDTINFVNFGTINKESEIDIFKKTYYATTKTNSKRIIVSHVISGNTVKDGVEKDENLKKDFYDNMAIEIQKVLPRFTKSDKDHNKDFFFNRIKDAFESTRYLSTNWPYREYRGLKYASLVGELIAHYRTANLPEGDNDIGVTVVGFSDNINELRNCEALGRSCNAMMYDGNRYLLANSAEELKGAFDKFTNKIMDKASLWYVGGPE